GANRCLLCEIPKCSAPLCSNLAQSCGTARRSSAESQGRCGRHGLLGHGRGVVQVRQEQGASSRVYEGAHVQRTAVAGWYCRQKRYSPRTIASVQIAV